MRKKTLRDRSAPKRNLSAYLLYQNGMRQSFKADHPHLTFGQLSKHTSVMYAALTPEEKATWQLKAETDKERYLAEMSKYIPPPGYDARGEAINAHTGSVNNNSNNAAVNGNYTMQSINMGFDHAKNMTGRTSRRVKCRDPHAPKRNLSAYLLYQNAMRDQFKTDNPGMTFGQLSKYTSHMYRSLTAQEKAQWEVRCLQDKARYEEEMSQYIPPPGFDVQGILIDTHPPSSLSSNSSKKMKKPKDPNAPKRARGSYVFFTNYIRPIIMKENPDTKFVELGSIMGERWRNIDPDEKRKYEALANEDRNRFNREMEDYNIKKAAAAAHAASATASNAYAMPQIMDQAQLHYPAHHMQLQQQQQQQQNQLHHQHTLQGDDSATPIPMISADQHQNLQQLPYQNLVQTQNFLPMEPNQTYSHPQFDSNHFQYSSTGQYNNQSNV